MKVVVIEDEVLAAEDLIRTIQDVCTEAEVISHLKSVQESMAYFQEDRDVHLIFSDIKLGDGLSFHIFEQISLRSPIVFCTAYDDYLLDAFKTNGIDYLLKPISPEAVSAALEKFRNLQRHLQPKIDLQESIFAKLQQEILQQAQQRSASVIVYQQDRIIPLPVQQIALCYIEFDNVFIKTFDAKEYGITKSLDELEKLLGQDFFRANRQYLMARRALKYASYTLSRKLHLELNIPHPAKVYVSREKAATFLRWLEGSQGSLG